ncbi:hypothetical protein [Methylobacter sp.]|uniref:hypothetical protein n=1 Tax=Methylobacter sp. TaxID=2051955 RepID=UPI003DA42D71
MFAATAATIVSGAVAERMHFSTYLIFSAFATGIIYPVFGSWAWNEHGWYCLCISESSRFYCRRQSMAALRD